MRRTRRSSLTGRSPNGVGRALAAAVALCAVPVSLTPPAHAADPGPAGPNISGSTNSSPPDRTVFRGSGARKASPRLSASGIFVVDATAAAASTGGNEPSIAIDPADPNKIAITRFTFNWDNNADLLYSTDGGATWTNETTIPAPPGVAGTSGGPCDQTIDYGRNGTLYGTFLTCSANAQVVSGSTTDPTNASSWSWNGNPAQLTSGTRNNTDQPWLLVNRDPANANQDNVYVAYDDFNGAPDARVAVSYGASPVSFTADNKAGTAGTTTNPGLRLATDRGNGTVYAVYEQSSGTTQPKNVTYRLNRSTDGGATWTLNGNADGLSVASVTSDQAPGFKFGGANALLGGIDHAAVDPGTHDVYVVYGEHVSGSANRIRIRRMTDNGSGGLAVGAAHDVSTATDTALPSVAVLDDGTIGVLYDSYDGDTTAGFPTYSAHLARSTDHGVTFSDTVLQTFQSPQKNLTSGCGSTDPTCARQRILGDYQQLKSVGNTFYGTFPGNTSGVPATNPPIDAIFFSVPQATGLTLSSSVNPSVYGQPVSFTGTVKPAPDGGTVGFSVDSAALGGPVAVDTTTGQATSSPIATLSPGPHSVDASYTGTANFKGSTAATLTQTVTRAPVATTLDSSANPSTWGQPVTFGDTVCPAGASTNPASPPSGTVTFSDGTTVLGTGTLSPGGGTNCARTQVTWSALLPGSHTITAVYSGDPNYEPGSPESLTQTVACTRTVTGTTGTVFALTGSTCVIGAHVNGSVLVQSGAAVFVSGSTVTGDLNAKGATLLAACGSTFGGSISASDSTGFVLIGDPGDDGCAPNTVGVSVSLKGSRAGAELVGNHIGGSVLLEGTTGTGPFPEDSRAEIEGNTVRGSLICSGNTPPPTNDGHPNTVTGPRLGQCSAL